MPPTVPPPLTTTLSSIDGEPHSTHHGRLLKVWENIRAYGAVGDASTNDTTAITNTANDVHTAGGGTVYVPEGIHMVNNMTFTGKSNIRFLGTGPGSILRPTAANNNIATFTDCTDIVFENIAIDNRACTAFAGLNFYDQTRARIQGCKFYDSSVQGGGSSDRYAIVFTRDNGTNTDIQFLDNHIADLQCEFDYCQGLKVSRNISRNAKKTCAFGTFTPAVGTLTNSDIEYSDNLIFDPDASHGGIYVGLDPDTTIDHTFKRIKIANNTVVYTATASNVGVKVGTVNISTATSGNVFDDIDIRGNRVIFNSSGAPTWSIQGANHSTMTCRRWTVKDNYVYGNTLGSEYAIRVDRVTDLEVNGNTVLNVPYGIAEVSCTDVRISMNRVEASITDYSAAGPIMEFDASGDLQWGPAGAFRFRMVDDGSLAYLQSTRALRFTDVGSGVRRAEVGTDGTITLANFLQMSEISEPANSAANDGRLFLKDNGAGKTQLCVRFGSGATQIIATEP